MNKQPDNKMGVDDLTDKRFGLLCFYQHYCKYEFPASKLHMNDPSSRKYDWGNSEMILIP